MRIFSCLALLSLLGACSSREPSGGGPAGAAPVGDVAKTVAGPAKAAHAPPTAPVVTEGMRRESALPLQTVAREDSYSEQVAALVANGRLVESDSDVIVFSGDREAIPNTPAGLFEDAVTLNRLRGRVNRVPGAPPILSTNVREGAATVVVSRSPSVAAMAALVEAVLGTEGVRRVRIEVRPQAG